MRRTPATPQGGRGVLALLVLLMTATACGSTVGTTGAGAFDGPAVPDGRVGSTPPPALRAGPPQDQGPGAGPVGATVTSPDAAGVGASPGAAVPSPGAPGTTSTGSLRGVTASTVKIGIGVADDGAAFTATLGLKGLDTGNARAQI